MSNVFTVPANTSILIAACKSATSKLDPIFDAVVKEALVAQLVIQFKTKKGTTYSDNKLLAIDVRSAWFFLTWESPKGGDIAEKYEKHMPKALEIICNSLRGIQ